MPPTEYTGGYDEHIGYVTDYAGDELTISEGLMGHVTDQRPQYMKEITPDRIAQIVADPRGGVYLNHEGHEYPHRLNYFDIRTETTGGKYHRVIADKTTSPGMICTALPTNEKGRLGECLLPPAGEDE